MIRRSLYGEADYFSISPFLAIMPVLSSVNELEQMTNAMFARYEQVVLSKKNVEDKNSDEYRKLKAEEHMLKSILDWLSVSLEVEK